jgi:plasmid stabilization system protein ParE
MGPRRCQRYLEDVRDAAKRIGADPGRARPLKGPYRIFRVRTHYLIVHVDPAADRVTIARVLHTAMDIERHLP